MKKGKLNTHPVRGKVIAAFCIFILVCVTYVMFNVYVPNQNSLNALSSVCMDIVCIVFLFIITSSVALRNYGSQKTTRVFTLLLVATVWAIFLDFLNWAFDGTLELFGLTYWFTLGSLCMGAVLATIFVLYLYSYLVENHGLESIKNIATFCAIVNVLSFFLTFILAITGTAFRFVNGHYETGLLYDAVTIIPVLSLLFITVYIIRHVKLIGVHDTFAVVGYILFMIAGAIIEGEYVIGTTYVSVAIADVFIFVMLQNEIIAKEKRNAQKWMEKSNTDELTGLLNRHAYEADLEMLERKGISDDFVYVSVDVNSLKLVNDSLGHFAGDELIIGATECLEKCFSSYGKLYRMGGDEFIALVNMDSDNISKIYDIIDSSTKDWSGELVNNLSLSCGYVSKSENPELSLREMAKIADERMYENKNEYYKKNGIDRRKSRSVY